MKTVLASLLLSILSSGPLFAQLSINNFGNTQTINFDGFLGTGFSPNPGLGALDSDYWQITDFSDGDTTFGGTFTSGQYARGFASGAVGGNNTEGIYAFNVDNGINVKVALGVQPTSNDFNDGKIVLWLQNNSGGTLTDLEVSFDAFYFNDTNRSNSLNFAYSLDNITYTDTNLDFSSPAASGASSWSAGQTLNTTIQGLNLSDGADFYIAWLSDRGGTGPTDDQLALDNINITAIPEPSTYSLVFGCIVLSFFLWRQKITKAKH